MLIRGDKLNPKVRAEVLAAYGYRWTVENGQRARAWCHSKHLPTIEPISDAEWISTHAFYVVKDGSRLMRNRRYAEPAYMAEP